MVLEGFGTRELKGSGSGFDGFCFRAPGGFGFGTFGLLGYVYLMLETENGM